MAELADAFASKANEVYPHAGSTPAVGNKLAGSPDDINLYNYVLSGSRYYIMISINVIGKLRPAAYFDFAQYAGMRVMDKFAVPSKVEAQRH